MNGTPHSHTAHLRRHYNSIQQGPHELEYGDTTVRVCGPWRQPTDRLVRRAFRRAVKRHDKGSQQAAQGLDVLFALQREVDTATTEGRWLA